MANPEHLEILKQGGERWNEWRKDHPADTPVLHGANLKKMDLIGADLGRANLRGANLGGGDVRDANLSGSDLTRANLAGANLTRSDLSKANLSMANLSWSNLNTANLRGTYLGWANLNRADLNEADLTDAQAHATSFAAVDLSTVKGLETIQHRSPSTIGMDTISKSHGKIPEVFLRGCGLQDWEIELVKIYQPNLGSADLTTILYRVSELRTGAPVRYSSCFISYSTKNQDFAERLHADLQAKGVRCWFAPEEMKGGRKLHEQIDEAIRLHDKLLLILSDDSMSSNWVKSEIANARERETREGKQLLFPITLVPYEAIKQWKLFDADIGVDSAREIREYFIPDFSNWKDHDSYQKAFQRLVKDLKAGASG